MSHHNTSTSNNPNKDADEKRRKLLLMLLTGSASVGITTITDTKAALVNKLKSQDEELHNNLLWAVAWKQTAAEYSALCYQAYNLARLRLDLTIQTNSSGDSNFRKKPLAIIVDIDDTVLHAKSYWGHLVKKNKDFFDDSIWDAWIPKNLMTAVPGSLDFLNYCAQQSVEVFYVTSRNQGTKTKQYALDQLKLLKFPFVDDRHLYLFTGTSDKTPARKKIAESYEVVLLIGDNLNDYSRDYTVNDIDQRLALMERDKELWGTKFILLPNPTDGHWVRAIFGDSEPDPTDENRRLLKAAASRDAWDGH